MILIDCQQGTPEWHQARTGVITASRFRDACETIAGKKKDDPRKPGSKALLYAAQVAVERISGQPCDEGFTTWQMRRGTELEPRARMEYEARTGNLASESGVVLTDDRLFGYSTDGFVGDDGLIEIKSLASAEKIIAMWRDRDFSDYMHQIQGGLWISGRKWADFVMYAPQLASVGKQLFCQRVPRDEAFIEQLETDLLRFAAMVADNERVLRLEAA